ncbi:ABC transporter G family member 37 [Citrus sinensis]|uniref:ABC transporter G family member 37 n=1 Tax=Citrus sinensis TaxID=2711 RepID=A0ACB8JNW4_CITSI|nr:ABC transporter G family member 37 [Citrus sinensis]
MAQMIGTDEIESVRIELAEIGRSLRSSFRLPTSSYRSSSAISSRKEDTDVEHALLWAEIERLPTYDRLKASLFDVNSHGNLVDNQGKLVIDVTKLGALERHVFIEKLIKHIEHDNLQLLWKIRKRVDKVGIKLPTIEVRYKNLCVEAKCEVVHGKPLPTLWNSFKGMISITSDKSNICYVNQTQNIESISHYQRLKVLPKLSGYKSLEAKINILNHVSGILKPGRMTLLLGPPGCGKSTFLKALSGNLDPSLKVTGEVSYNGYKLEEFVPQKTSAYISQNDLHIAEMTVRETVDFSARCQGVGSREETMMEVSRREKEAGIVPDPDIDTYMKILGLDVCADTMVGNAMRRGISGGQKKRLTTGEMIVGPTKALFMDEITNGLDSSTAYQIIACIQQLVHITDSTALISLLQPAPETFDLFDDIILMAEGKIVYHGPQDHVLAFFEDCGFRCPERKGVSDFLQEVLSRKDQAQFWLHTELPYSYFSVDMFSKKFKESPLVKKLDEELLVPYDKSKSPKNAISFSVYSLSRWELFKACMSRELLLMRRNSFVYVFKTTQLIMLATMAMTVFLRTRMEIDVFHGNYYMGSLYFSLVVLLVDGMPELSMTIQRLEVFYKQQELCFYPAWAYAIPATILKVPLSLVASLAWTCLTYYVIGYSPEVWRFFRQFILLFASHFTSISMFRFMASVFQTEFAAMTAGSVVILFVFLFGGFVISRPSMPAWLKWGFWISPVTYGEIGLSVNEFLAPRWQKMLPTNTTIGQEILESRGLNFDGFIFWISLGALFGIALLLNIGFTLALTFLKSSGSSRVMISHEKLAKMQESEDSSYGEPVKENSRSTPMTNKESYKGRMVLPFEPLTVAFQDLKYYVDTPLEMRERGFADRKLRLLYDVTGSLRPGVLTALMGVSGAGKTTLMDVLAGRKTSGYVEGEIKISGYPKVQETFARVSGYCEQTDIHSPNITVEESVIFSAWLRLAPEINSKTKAEFVNEVLETIELDAIKDSLVGIPGVNGLSTEQRKRLTIAVELVANPSIIFMDEPTTGLDARAAAIVMRAVKNIVNTGRTIVCTIHQPSIDIFEAFDELILLKTGGRIIYCGPLGKHSSQVIEYFEGISGVPKIRNNYNPATWVIEVTSTSAEAELCVDFAQIFRESVLYEDNQQDLFNIVGSSYLAVVFLGINNCSSVIPNVARERTVMYREGFAGMYSPWAYALAQVTVEIPYLLIQALSYVIIGYPMIGYYWSAYKLFWNFYGMFCTMMFYNYLGMLLVSLTPNSMIASILSSVCYTLFNLFAGFLIPGPKIPKWWIWMYYMMPTSWALNAMVTSQYGDIDKEMIVFGETKKLSSFIQDYFGFHHDRLPITAAVLLIYPLVLAFLFAFCIERLNFLRRSSITSVGGVLALQPEGIGNITKQAFTHISFWVQILNIPIMAMNTKAISRPGAIIGSVEEVETNEDGECIGKIARVRIRVDVTKHLKKIIFLESEGEEKVPMPVTYERLPDFYFCCGIIGHQFRECVKYKTQKQKNFAFGPWMKAVTVSECLNHNKSNDRWNISNNTRMEENGQQDC